MKRFVFTLALILLSCICVMADVRVLSVCISEYPKSSGWNALSAHNDMQLIKSLFPAAKLLENKDATFRGIVSELRCLSHSVSPGDTVVVHLSGHGQQIVTHNSATEIDGVDEAFVPFDAAKRMSASYRGQYHLTDDVFGREIDMLRRAVGPKGLVITLIDACHSDSMDRTTDRTGEVFRGTDEIFGAEKMSGTEILNLKTKYHNQDSSVPVSSDKLSHAIYISACRSDKRNYEIEADGKGYGSLTYYFCKAYEKTGFSSLPNLLSELYSGMQSDVVLQFHGQLPVVRNTIGWLPPRKVGTQTKVGGKPQKPHSNGFPGSPALWGIAALISLIVIVRLWMRRNR